jgi:toxin ParE1/3/4
MRRRLRQSKAAERDIAEILRYTEQHFGVDQALAYLDLLEQATLDIEREPQRPTSKSLPTFGEGVRSYRVELSARRSGAGVKSSHHVIYYTLASADEILVLRILHDAMEPETYLPAGYETRSQPDED